MSSTDPRLDWRSFHDPRSLTFRAVDMVSGPRQSRAWRPGPKVLDQKREGGCVGWSISHWLSSSPTRLRDVDDAFAYRIYKDAQTRFDPWPGENYSGTSVLAGAKAAQAAGYISAYYWTFSVEELAEVVMTTSGAVIGIPWHNSCYLPDKAGVIRPDGNVVGGHAILVRGFHPRRRLTGHGTGPTFTLLNSWGPQWGLRGSCYIRQDDLRALLADDGEACVPVVNDEEAPS